MVLVEGSPGIGKTTFCLKIVNDWARKAIPKKHDFPVFELMLLLKCRDMDGDLTQAIDDQLLPEDMTKKKKKKLLDYINNEKEQDKILIILDGLDELPQVAEKAVDKLLRRKVLSSCSVLATSRQEKGIEIRQRHVFDTLLQINGFTIEDASEYIRKHFRAVGRSQADLLKGECLIQAIEENIFLHALRNNPLNVLLLCIVFEDHKGELPSNRTKLYQIIYRCLLGRFCAKYDIASVDKEDEEAKTDDKAKEDDEAKDDDDFALEKQCEDRTLALGQLAWRCLLEERPSFRQKELDKLEKSIANGKGVSAAKVGVVFMEASVKKLNPKHEYHFLHKTFQEFLAATYLAQLIKENVSTFDKFQFNKSDITSKYRQVFLFAAGILGKDGTILFQHIGEILSSDWNWKSSDEDCRFLIELLNESGAPDNLSMVAPVCQSIPLRQSLELSMKDRHTLRFVQYAYESCSLGSNVEPLWMNTLSLTKVHALDEDSANDLHAILRNNKILKDLVISTDVTQFLASTLLKGLSSNSSLSSLTLKTFKSTCIPADVADTLGTGLSLCNSLRTVKLKLSSGSNAWASDVSGTGLLKSTQLESVDLEYYGVPDNTAVDALKLLLAKRSLISFSLTLIGNMEDCLASALSEGLADETALNSFSLVIHGSLSNHGATLLANGFLLNRTLHSLALKVLGDLPEHWTGVVDKIHELTANKSWKSFTLHPNMKGKFVDASFSFLGLISRAGLLEKTLTINLWGELTIHNVDVVGGHLLQTSPLSSLTLNVNGKVSNNVADCLVDFFVANNVLLSLTINLIGEITNCGQTALQRLQREGHLQSFILNVDGLVTEDWECLSAQNNCTTSFALPIDISNLTLNEVREIFIGSKSLAELSIAVDSHVHLVHNYAGTQFEGSWGYGLDEGLSQNKSLNKFSLELNDHANTSGIWVDELVAGLSKNKSLTSCSLTVHNYAHTETSWGNSLGQGLPNIRSLTTFSLTVHNYTDTTGGWAHVLGQGLSNNESLTTFSLTVHNYTDKTSSWGHGLDQGLSNNKSLTTFSLTVHNYDDTLGWAYGMSQGLSNNKSLTTFSLTVHNYADTTGSWGYILGQSLSNNKSLTTFHLTVHNYADTTGSWGYVLGQGLLNIRSLTTFSLTVHNYADTRGSWGYVLGQGLSNNKSLTTFSLTVHNYADTTSNWAYGLVEGLSNNESLTTFSFAVHNYADTEGRWGYVLDRGLLNNNSLTTFSLTVHNYADTEGNWGYGLGQGLSNNKSLTTFSLTVHNYADTEGNWGYGLGQGLLNNKSLTTFSLTVHVYTDSSKSWVHNMANGLAKSCSLTTLRLAVNYHTGVNRDLDDPLFTSLEEIESLSSLNISVSLYGEDSVELN